METRPNRIIWHHSADPYPGHQFERIDAYHKRKLFPRSSLGYYVGYHYLIEQDGTIHKARLDTEIGAHDAGENYASIGICLAGNFNVSNPTEAQTEAAATLIDELRTKWDIPITRIEPHRWRDTTECPGNLLSDYWLVIQYLQRKVGWLRRLLLARQIPK